MPSKSSHRTSILPWEQDVCFCWHPSFLFLRMTGPQLNMQQLCLALWQVSCSCLTSSLCSMKNDRSPSSESPRTPRGQKPSRSRLMLEDSGARTPKAALRKAWPWRALCKIRVTVWTTHHFCWPSRGRAGDGVSHWTVRHSPHLRPEVFTCVFVLFE